MLRGVASDYSVASITDTNDSKSFIRKLVGKTRIRIAKITPPLHSS